MVRRNLFIYITPIIAYKKVRTYFSMKCFISPLKTVQWKGTSDLPASSMCLPLPSIPAKYCKEMHTQVQSTQNRGSAKEWLACYLSIFSKIQPRLALEKNALFLEITESQMDCWVLPSVLWREFFSEDFSYKEIWDISFKITPPTRFKGPLLIGVVAQWTTIYSNTK